MKKISFKYLALIALIPLFLTTSCEKSVKGKWTERDKKTYINDCLDKIDAQLTDIPSLAKLGETTSEEKEQICGCFVKKLERDNHLPEASYNSVEIAEILGTSCMFETLFGGKGNWTPKIKAFFRNSYKERIENAEFPEIEKKIADCVVAKLENQFNPQDMVKLKDTFEQIIEQMDSSCVNDIEKNKK